MRYSIRKVSGLEPQVNNLTNIVLSVINAVKTDRSEDKLSQDGYHEAVSILNKNYPNSKFEVVETLINKEALSSGSRTSSRTRIKTSGLGADHADPEPGSRTSSGACQIA